MFGQTLNPGAETATIADAIDQPTHHEQDQRAGDNNKGRVSATQNGTGHQSVNSERRHVEKAPVPHGEGEDRQQRSAGVKRGLGQLRASDQAEAHNSVDHPGREGRLQTPACKARQLRRDEGKDIDCRNFRHHGCIDLGEEDVDHRPDGGEGRYNHQENGEPPVEAAGDAGLGQNGGRIRRGAHPHSAGVIDDGNRARPPIWTRLNTQNGGAIAGGEGA